MYNAPRDRAIRLDGNAAALLSDLRRIIRDADPEQPIADVGALSDLLAAETSGRRHQPRLLGAFPVVAFGLAALGIYGVPSFLVSQRRREIGVRMALGADTVDVMRLILGRGLLLSALGLALGVGGGLTLGFLMHGLLFGVKPFDPAVLSISGGLCLLASLLACSVPAWRAARVDPLQAVRAE